MAIPYPACCLQDDTRARYKKASLSRDRDAINVITGPNQQALVPVTYCEVLPVSAPEVFMLSDPVVVLPELPVLLVSEV